MANPQDLFFSKDHEWIDIVGNIATIGISDHAQQSLGDIVFIELPEVSTIIDSGEQIGSIESVKSTSDLYSPIQGEVVEVNKLLEEAPETINKDPYEEGWILKLKINPADIPEELMDYDSYTEFVESSG